MGGTTLTCPKCLITYRIRYDLPTMYENLEGTPFYLKDGEVHCKKCKVDVTTLWGFEKYLEDKFGFVLFYDKKKLEDALDRGYYLEAIGMIHIQIMLQLRYLVIKTIREVGRIPADEENMRFKSLMNLFKDMRDKVVIELAYVFEIIDENNHRIVSELNSLRNTFGHELLDRRKYEPRQIKTIINQSTAVEKKLGELIKKSR